MADQIHLAIATRDRPHGLARMLRALRLLVVPPGVDLTIHVLDNSGDGAAAAGLRARAPVLPGALCVTHVPTPGLSRVRNAALEAALGAGASHLGFIDDDEVPSARWLVTHLDALGKTGAAASVGTVRAHYVRPPPEWLRRGRFLEVGGWDNLRAAPFVTTGNIVFSLEPVRQTGLRFDPGFNSTGGEVTAFFAAFEALAGPVIYAADAVVTEEVPPSRMQFAWLWRRWRRTGQTSAVVRLMGGHRLVCAGHGLLRIAGGGAMAAIGAPALIFGRPLSAKGARVAARGLGFLDIACGHMIADYGNGTAPARERATATATSSSTTTSCGR